MTRPLAVVTACGSLGTSYPLCPIFTSALAVSGTGSIGMAPSNLSTPPSTYYVVRF